MASLLPHQDVLRSSEYGPMILGHRTGPILSTGRTSPESHLHKFLLLEKDIDKRPTHCLGPAISGAEKGWATFQAQDKVGGVGTD